jgi:hypothetical protein
MKIPEHIGYNKIQLFLGANPQQGRIIQSMFCYILWVECQVVKAQAMSSMDCTRSGKLYGKLGTYNNVKIIHPNLNFRGFLCNVCSITLYIRMSLIDMSIF